MLHPYEEPAIPYQPGQDRAQVAPQNDPAPSRPKEVQTSYTGNSFDVSPNASQFPTPRRRVGGLRTGAIRYREGARSRNCQSASRRGPG